MHWTILGIVLKQHKLLSILTYCSQLSYMCTQVETNTSVMLFKNYSVSALYCQQTRISGYHASSMPQRHANFREFTRTTMLGTPERHGVHRRTDIRTMTIRQDQLSLHIHPYTTNKYVLLRDEFFRRDIVRYFARLLANFR